MNKDLYKSLFCLPLLIAAFVLVLLPGAAAYNTATEPGEVHLETFSYFDSSVFGYTNFAPFLTALCVCAALLLLAVYCFTRWYWFAGAAKSFVFGGVVFSMLPLLFGVHYVSTIAILISVVLIAQLPVMHFLIPEPKSK